MRRIVLISTGGTIEKTYDERNGRLENRNSIVHRMLARLRLEDVAVSSVQLMHKDSLDLTEADRRRIVDTVRVFLGDAEGSPRAGPPPTAAGEAAGGESADGGSGNADAVIVLHGTDTLHLTGERLCAELRAPRCPVILTGAMRPFDMKRSDALQNLNEAIFAAGVLAPGVYCVAHGRALRFPGVVKDRERGTFRRAEGA